jgi:hypothetical protein
MNYTHSVTVPIHYWFFYQAWLAQNSIYPLTHYVAYPIDLVQMSVDFNSADHSSLFTLHWQHTFLKP